jgi:hypothetical protein
MLKVNLEKELIRQNKSLVSAKELLLIKEYDTLGESVTSDEAIKRVFGDTAAKQGKEIASRVEELKEKTKQFDQSRVFHISQIEKLCKKYHLKFLPSCHFTGRIDKELPGKINQFEIANGVVCKAWKMESWRDSYTEGNTFIAAPASSFKLEERPKDPLLFYQINTEYFYLIHKWGNDLNFIRRFYPLLSNALVSYLMIALPIAAIMVYCVIQLATGQSRMSGFQLLLTAACGIFLLVFSIHQMASFEDKFRFVKKSTWNSKYRDE